MQKLIARACLGGVWLSVVAAVVGFLLPWATLDVQSARLAGQLGQVAQGTPLEALAGTLRKRVGTVVIQLKRGTETFTGQLPDLSQIPTHVNGPQIPQFVNRRDAQVVMALAEMLTGQRQLGAKSYAVYLLPGLAILCGVLLTLTRRVRLVCLLVALACWGIAGVGCWKLLTTKTETLLVAITIGRGLWLSLWAYVGIGMAALALAIVGPSRPAA